MALWWLWVALPGLASRGFSHLALSVAPSSVLCQGALSKTRAFLARFLVYTAKPGGWLTCQCAASASTAFCPRRRCLAGGSPVQPRRISHVGRVTYCG